MLFPHLRQLHDCRFIKDVTVPDGTVMAPSTPFTKIWRIHNNGSSMWPYGTCLTWVGGHLFARNSSVKLGVHPTLFVFSITTNEWSRVLGSIALKC